MKPYDTNDLIFADLAFLSPNNSNVISKHESRLSTKPREDGS